MIEFAYCESYIERYFAEGVQKYLHDAVEVEQQVEVQTICGLYRLDFVLGRGKKRVAVECDGKEFHNAYRDEWRDALILETGKVQTIYRFRGCDLHYRPDDLLYLMSKWEADLFSERGRENLKRLASDAVRTVGDERPWPFREIDTEHGPMRILRQSLPKQGERSASTYYIQCVRDGLAKGLRTLDGIIKHAKKPEGL